MLSLWSATSDIPSFDTLKGDAKTDVLIIGGGLAGILCAYELKNRGIGCLLVEADKICSGITKNTTAKITSQHGFIYDKITKKFGVENAQKYLQANENAVKKYAKLCKDIECDFEEKDNIVYCVDNYKKVEKELIALQNIGYKTQIEYKLPVPIGIAGAIRFKNQAQFNPLKFVSHIVKDLNIYENTKVIEIRDNVAITNRGNIKAEIFIVATHFPFMNKHGAYFVKMYQHRSYVIAIDRNNNLGGMYVDEAKTGMSFRNAGDLLLIGGGDHRTGKQGGSYNELRRFAKTYYPENHEKYHWATQDCMTLDSIAYIGEYSKNTPNVYVATGFNKWGMTTSMVASEILCDIISGKKNDYADLFSPQRSMLTPQLPLNIGESVLGLIAPSTKRCPHLGCALKWNSAERTWDCPCHGSRFTEKGQLIDNPSTDDLKQQIKKVGISTDFNLFY